jgi:hypothetical protein
MKQLRKKYKKEKCGVKLAAPHLLNVERCLFIRLEGAETDICISKMAAILKN